MCVWCFCAHQQFLNFIHHIPLIIALDSSKDSRDQYRECFVFWYIRVRPLYMFVYIYVCVLLWIVLQGGLNNMMFTDREWWLVWAKPVWMLALYSLWFGFRQSLDHSLQMSISLVELPKLRLFSIWDAHTLSRVVLGDPCPNYVCNNTCVLCMCVYTTLPFCYFHNLCGSSSQTRTL